MIFHSGEAIGKNLHSAKSFPQTVIKQKDPCACYSWDRVNFLQSSKYGAMLWICEENSVDNPGIFSLLLNGVYTRVRAFSALHLTPPRRGLGVHEELGRDTAWTADPTDQRDIPDHMAS